MTLFREKKSKFRNVKTEYGGRVYHSKFEAGQAMVLDIRKKAGEILDWEPQFQIECIPYDCNGDPVPKLKVRHKVDFRVHELDGSYTLLEAKGTETTDWRRRRDWLLHFWIPEHPDHEYLVVKDAGKGRGLRWSSR